MLAVATVLLFSVSTRSEPPSGPPSTEVFVRLPSALHLSTGQRQSISLVIANPSDQTNFFTLSLAKKPPGWLARVDPTNIEMAPRQELPLRVTLIPHRGPPSFTEQRFPFDVVVKAEDMRGAPFFATVEVFLKPGWTDVALFFGTPLFMGLVSASGGLLLRRFGSYRLGGLLVLGGGTLAMVAGTAILGLVFL